MSNGVATPEDSLAVPRKVKFQITQQWYDPAIPFLGISPRELETYVATTYNVHSNIIYNGLKVETTQIIISGLRNKMCYPYNRILLNRKK